MMDVNEYSFVFVALDSSRESMGRGILKKAMGWESRYRSDTHRS